MRNCIEGDCSASGKTNGHKTDGPRAQNGSHQHHNNHHQGMTSVNVIVAPHFDHIYARYQQFLPPAIASDMEKSVFAQQAEHDSNPDADFLKHGFRDEYDDSDDDDNDDDGDGDDADSEGQQRPIDNRAQIPTGAPAGTDDTAATGSVTVKLEKVEAEPPRVAAKMNGNARQRLKLCWNGATAKLNAVSVAFTRQRKVHRAAISRRVRQSLASGGRKAKEAVEVKQEMTADEHGQRDDAAAVDGAKGDCSDGYATDSTVPMVTRRQRMKRGQAARNRAVATPSRKSTQMPIKRKASTNKACGPPEKRYRSKRKRTRPLRIDE